MISPNFWNLLLHCLSIILVLSTNVRAQDCGAPGDVQYGEFAGSTLFNGDAQIVCWYGFTGSTAITCPAGVWDPLPTCAAIDCGSPAIPSGTISTDTAYNDTTLVTCNTGYQGGGRAYCLTSGDWYSPPFPQCEPVECWDPDIPNGRLTTDSDTVFDGSATVECDPGFEVIGSNVATCLFDGNWDTLPTCQPKDCGTPPILHGSLTPDSSMLYGGKAEVVCDTGYLGYGFATCLTTGLWDTAALPICSPIDCGTPFVYHGFLTGTMETVYDGNTTIGCEPGYEFGGTATCLATGLWDELTMPTCDPVDCGTSVDPNGVLEGDSFFAGLAKITCNTGYTGGGKITCQDTAFWDMSAATACALVDCGSPGDPNGNLVGVSTYGGSPSMECNTGFVGGGLITCLPSGEWDKSSATTCVLADCGSLSAPLYGNVAVTTTTYGSSATFTCESLYDMSGNNVLTCNADGVWSSAPPTCIDIDCPSLSPPAFGTLSSPEVTVGTTTFVNCYPGYSLFGLSPLTCEVGGTWDDDVGVCELDCPSLVEPTYGTLSSTAVMEQTVIEVECDKGYTMFGDAVLECLNGGTWNTTVPDCVRECGSLDDPVNGYVSQPDGTTLDDVSTYTCNTGYYLSHTNSRVCQSDGTWSNTIATCIIYDCHHVMPPENASVTYPTGTTYNETVEYSCDIGFDLIGPSSRICKSDGTWDLIDPYCQIRDCGPIASPTAGSVNISEGTVYLSVAVFDCNLGFTMVGSATSRCEATASWSEPTPDCNINDCGPLSDPVDGQVVYMSTTYTSTALYSCNTGYYLMGVSDRTCQAESSWSDEAPTCVIKDCGLIESPSDGSVTYSNSATTYQEVASFSCDIGFDLIGDTTRTCMDDGMWGGATPVCQIKDCGSLPDPVNGVVNTSAGTTYTEVANYTCDIGYNLVGDNQRNCMANGQWSGSAPVCNIKDCGSLSDPADGSVSASVTTYDSVAVYSCNAGYYLIGAENRTCQHDATWSDTAPGCARKDCGEPSVIENGFYTIPTGTQYGDTAVYSCDANYGLVGTATIACLSTGEWSTLPHCSQDCMTPPSIDNGNFSTPDHTLLGAVVTYTCNDGYYMVRDENITCLGQGAWTKPPGCKLIPKAYNEECLVTAQCLTDRATCRPEVGTGLTRCLCNTTGQVYDALVDSCLADCGPLANPVHGTVTLPSVTSEGQIAVYSCDLNFALDLFDFSLAIRACSSTGQWNGTAPECTEGCQPPVPPNHGYVSAPNGYARAYKIYYSCAPGYVLHGNADRDCLAATLYTGGQDYWLWGNTDPVCLIECPLLSDIENGNVDMSKGRTAGSIATYICENNYALIGKPVRKCLPTGKWKGVEPLCVIAIFPDILMAIGAVMIFLVILDILGILFCVYRKFIKKKKDKNKPKYYSEDGELILDADDTDDALHPGLQRSSFRSLGPARDSFRGYENLGPDATKTEDTTDQMTPRIEQARSTLPRPRKPEDLNNYENDQFPFEPPYGVSRNLEYNAETDFDSFLQKEFQPKDFDENEYLGPNLEDDELSIDLPNNNVKEDKKNFKDLKLRNRSKSDKRPVTKLEDASTLFKGRMSLPKGPGGLGSNADSYYTDDARRYLRETVETYTPVTSNQQQSKS